MYGKNTKAKVSKVHKVIANNLKMTGGFGGFYYGLDCSKLMNPSLSSSLS